MIRDARPEDASQIRDFWNDEIRDTHITFNSVEKTTDEIAKLIIDRQGEGFCFLVSETHGQIEGFATYSQFRPGIGYRHTGEHTVIISPTARHCGIGQALIAAVEKHAKAADFHVMIAGISAENPAAVTFHKTLGYEMVATLPEVGRKFDQWIDLLLLQKRL